ncbi:hypothetical protein ACRYGS_20875 [Mycobacteroides abscessus]
MELPAKSIDGAEKGVRSPLGRARLSVRSLVDTGKTYYRWQKEVGDHLREQGQAAKFYRALPLLLFSYLILIASPWMLNITAMKIAELEVIHIPRLFARVSGDIAFYPNGYSLLGAILYLPVLVVFARKKISPHIRDSIGWRKAGYCIGLLLYTLWSALLLYAIARMGLLFGIQFMLSTILWILILCFWLTQIGIYLLTFTTWFWIMKIISIYKPLLGLAITGLAFYYGVNIARFLADASKFAYPANLHHLFGVISVSVVVIQWYATVCNSVATAIPWIVKFRIVLGLRREGDSFREGSYYQRWCNQDRDEWPTVRQAVIDGWRTRGERSDSNLWQVTREVFREVFH